MTDTTPAAPSLFTRARHPFALKDGTEVVLQPLNPREHELLPAVSRNEDGSVSTALFSAHLVMYGLVEPKPSSVDEVLEAGDLMFELADEILYLSGMAERPGEGAEEEPVDGEEVAPDPLADEFREAGDPPVTPVVGEAAVVPGVREAVGGDRVGDDAGHAAVDGGGRDGAAGSQPPVARSEA